MKKVSIISIAALVVNASICPFSFKSLPSLPSLFSFERYEEVVQQEIPASQHRALSLKNTRGPIHIQTWQQPKILLKATKHATKQELLPTISIDVQSSSNNSTIKTVYADEKSNGSVEYQLLVPATININITTDTSPIKIEHINGTVSVRAENADIELHAIQGPIDVAIANKGSVTIEQPGNNIKVATHSGSIDIHDAKKNIFATTDYGKIRMSCKHIPDGSTIKLDASQFITLQLPSDINADIQAETEQGNILCDHYVTIKPFITQLNSKAWTQFKRSVTGTLGKGGSQISLHSVSGNIKVTKTT